MIQRNTHLSELGRLLKSNPIVAMLGARQVGKTTLAKTLVSRRKGPTHFFDLESPVDIAQLADPILALAQLRGLVVLDEIQRRPEIFPAIRVLADRQRSPT